jgi:2-amino-4-hydroxy-6-hydroxymethyldihydropteridine diphosphokinase
VGRVTAAVAIGANLGDRAAHLAFARARLAALLCDCRFSTIHETEPVGVSGIQPAFLNAAAVGLTDLTPQELLDALLAVEQARGRERPRRNAPRTLDLDLVLYGSTVVDLPELIVPHPRFRERLFVLEPLSEIAPAMIDPISGKSVGELLQLRRGHADRE